MTLEEFLKAYIREKQGTESMSAPLPEDVTSSKSEKDMTYSEGEAYTSTIKDIDEFTSRLTELLEAAHLLSEVVDVLPNEAFENEKISDGENGEAEGDAQEEDLAEKVKEKIEEKPIVVDAEVMEALEIAAELYQTTVLEASYQGIRQLLGHLNSERRKLKMSPSRVKSFFSSLAGALSREDFKEAWKIMKPVVSLLVTKQLNMGASPYQALDYVLRRVFDAMALISSSPSTFDRLVQKIFNQTPDTRHKGWK